MDLINKHIDDWIESDLQTLVDNKIAEAKTLDYKRQCYGNSDDDKKEFLRDVTSFANTAGGYIVIGMDEDDGQASSLLGVNLASIDDEIRRLENILRDGVKPRIPRVEIGHVVLGTGHFVILIRIPQSWTAPHMVTFRGLSQFWARNSKGKYQLDVDEIRTAFKISEGFSETIRNFRVDRLAKIAADDIPIKMVCPPRIVLHIIPFSSFGFNRPLFDIKNLQRGIWTQAKPMGGGGGDDRINFDGILAWSPASNDSAQSYLQVFRNGIIESVSSAAFSKEGSYGWPKRIVAGMKFEEDILKALQGYFVYLKNLGVDAPYIITLSMHNILEYQMYVGAGAMLSHPPIFDRNDLILSERILETLENIDVAAIMRPMFDTIWNAAAIERSPNYD